MNYNNINLNLTDECPRLHDMIPFENIDLFPSYHDIAILNDQIAKLTIDLNTQSLRIEVEKTKRQKLNIILKRIRHEKTLPDHSLMGIRNDINVITEQLGAVRNMYESELARIGLTTYRCFTRLHQILITTVPRIPMPEAEYNDVSQLLHELLRNIEQLRSPYDHSLSTSV